MTDPTGNVPCEFLPLDYQIFCTRPCEDGAPDSSKTPSKLRRLTAKERDVLTLFVLKETSEVGWALGRTRILNVWPGEQVKRKIWALLNKATFDADKINKKIRGESGTWSIYVSWHGEESKLINETLGPEAAEYGFNPNNFDEQLNPLAVLASKYASGERDEEGKGLRTSTYFSIVKNHARNVERSWFSFGPNGFSDTTYGGLGFIDAPGLCKDGYQGTPDYDILNCENPVSEDDLRNRQFLEGFRLWYTMSNSYTYVSELFELGKDEKQRQVWNFTVYQKKPSGQ